MFHRFLNNAIIDRSGIALQIHFPATHQSYLCFYRFTHLFHRLLGLLIESSSRCNMKNPPQILIFFAYYLIKLKAINILFLYMMSSATVLAVEISAIVGELRNSSSFSMALPTKLI